MSIIKLFKLRTTPADRFEQLVSPHIGLMYRLAYRLCQNEDDAEEVLQLLLIKLYPKLDELDQVDSLRPWLMRSLYNLYVDSYRKQQRTLAVISPDEIPDSIETGDRNPYQEIELDDQQRLIVDAMQQINEEQRIVIMLHDVEGYTLPEVSDILQTPVGTLKSRLHRGRTTLRELADKELADKDQADKELFADQYRDTSNEESLL